MTIVCFPPWKMVIYSLSSCSMAPYQFKETEFKTTLLLQVSATTKLAGRLILSSGGQRVNTPILSPPRCHIAYFPFSTRSRLLQQSTDCLPPFLDCFSPLCFRFLCVNKWTPRWHRPRRVSWCLDKKGGYATALECRRMAGGAETECPISPGNPPLPGETLQIPIVKIRTMKPTLAKGHLNFC